MLTFYFMIMMNFPLILTTIVIILLMKTKFNPIKFMLLIIMFMLTMNLYSLMFIDSIYLMIIMLMYISGLLTLFAYFISLINKKTFSKKSSKSIMIILILLPLVTEFSNSKFPLMKISNPKTLKIFKIYHSPPLMFISLAMILLLTTLVISIKICKNNKSALRQMKDE